MNLEKEKRESEFKRDSDYSKDALAKIGSQKNRLNPQHGSFPYESQQFEQTNQSRLENDDTFSNSN